MLGEGGTPLAKLLEAIREFVAREDRPFDLKGLRAGMDSLECEFSVETRAAQVRGDHLGSGNPGVVTWVGRLCGMSTTSSADRLCVGTQLESLPKTAEALRAGEISYQSTSLLCHLREQLGEKRELFIEDEMLDLARQHSVATLRHLCRYARHVADPDGFFNDAEADYSLRRLHISQMSDGMHAIDGILDQAGGAALKTALDSLSNRRGPEDDRTFGQRNADALVELANHAMDEGRLPKRNGVKPHINLTTTIECLKNELGAGPADLELSLPISTRTLERLACDCTMSRVLLADSMVIDVGRATRTVSAPMRRALRVRDRGCRWPGCDRQVPTGAPAPHRVLGERWSESASQPCPALLLPPSAGA